jgi:multiple antibiotic resistance protein
MPSDLLHDLPGYARFFISLFAILSPFAAIPLFLELTNGFSTGQKSRTAAAASATVGAVLIVSGLAGEPILAALGTSLDAFRVGGGIVLLLVALSMLSAQTSTVQHRPEEAAEADTSSSVGVVPLGIPLLAGPGSISSVIIEMNQAPNPFHRAAIVVCVLAVCAATWTILRLAYPIGQFLGRIGLNVLRRLFGLILAAIAIQVMATGLRGLFPGLA